MVDFIYKKQDTKKYSSLRPGHWCYAGEINKHDTWVYTRCPICKFITRLGKPYSKKKGHIVSDEGIVKPSMVCPHKIDYSVDIDKRIDCTFHVWAKLENWK